MASPIPAVEPLTTAWRPDRSILMENASLSIARSNATDGRRLTAAAPQRASSRVAIAAHSSGSGTVGTGCPARRYQ